MAISPSTNLRIAHLEELLEIEYEKLGAFEQELAITSSAPAKFELRQRIKRELLPSLRTHETEYAELLAQRTDPTRIPPQQAEASIIEVRQAVEHIQALPVAQSQELTRLLTDVRQKLDEPGKTAAAKLKVALPIIPLVASYEMELDTENALRTAWRGLKKLFGGKV
jgi:hypothetical protein